MVVVLGACRRTMASKSLPKQYLFARVAQRAVRGAAYAGFPPLASPIAEIPS